jgi:hypothetical protein
MNSASVLVQEDVLAHEPTSINITQRHHRQHHQSLMTIGLMWLFAALGVYLRDIGQIISDNLKGNGSMLPTWGVKF